MSIPSEDYPAVKFSSLAVGTALPPAIVLLVVIVSIVGLLLALLILWYFLSGRAREVAKMTQLQEVEGLDEFTVREVLREEDVSDHQSSVRTAGLLEVPRYRGNPPVSPSIFSTGIVLLEEVPKKEITTAVVSVSGNVDTADTCRVMDKCEINISEEAFELESIDLDSPPLANQLEGQVEVEETWEEQKHNFLAVQEASVYLSSTSLNVFQDNQYDGGLLVPSVGVAGSVSDVSFRSAKNTLRTRSSSCSPVSRFSSQLLDSKNRSPPVFRIKFEDQGSTKFLPCKKNALWDKDISDRLMLDCSVQMGTEF